MEATKHCENCNNLANGVDFICESKTRDNVQIVNEKHCYSEDDKSSNSNADYLLETSEELEKLMEATCQIDGADRSVLHFASELDINEILPEEAWITILLYCDVRDIISFGLTSKLAKKQFIDKPSNYFWKKKFFDLLKKRDFNVDDYKPLQYVELDKLQYREICQRFSRIYDSGEEGELVKCGRCRRYTCLQGCVEEGPQKVAVDIGSKLTWVVSPTASLKRHQSILGIPKVVKCVDCDSVTKHRLFSLKGVCNCPEPDQEKEQSQLRSSRFTYSSQELGGMLDTCCLFCKHRVFVHDSRENHLMRGYCEEIVDIDTGKTSPAMEALCSGFCADAASQMKLKSVDFASPSLALRLGGCGLGVAASFLQHVLTQCSVLEGLRKPCGVLILCEDINWSREVRQELLFFLFIRLKVSRVCLVPRSLAVCAELGLKTAVVVDSGALYTAVSVVLGGRVIISRCREVQVGGRHIAESLHCAHACDDESQEIPVSSLDSPDVKEQCWLSYNMATERQRECTVRCESIWVPAPNRRNMRIKSWKQILLGNEVFRAPEYMYAQLGLPQVIVEVTRDLPSDQLRDCLSHIALTGGNTCLTGFEQRLRRDLTELLPEHDGVIDLVKTLGSRSCDAAVGSTYIPFPMKQGILPEPPEPGTPCWLSRDDFIFYGTQRL